jgi:cell division septation protein DedD
VRFFSVPIALVLGLACAALVACGGSSGSDADLIPAARADKMQRQLDRIRSAVDGGSCSGVSNDVAVLQQQVNSLSSSVDASLRRRLQEGVDNLAQISPDECFANADAKTQTETTPTETTPTETTPTETTPTTPPPTTDTTPTVPPPTTTPPTTTPPTDGGAGGATIPSDPDSTGGASPTP